MRAIARHLAITASAVHYYFPSRQALLDALVFRDALVGHVGVALGGHDW